MGEDLEEAPQRRNGASFENGRKGGMTALGGSAPHPVMTRRESAKQTEGLLPGGGAD